MVDQFRSVQHQLLAHSADQPESAQGQSVQFLIQDLMFPPRRITM
jgi:hypothetical protein